MKNRLRSLNHLYLKGCFIAGGAVLSTVTKKPINDYDVYPKSEESLKDAITRLTEDECFLVNISDRAITFKSNQIKNDDGERAIIQVMTFDFFETAEKIFNKFDFTVCMGAYDCDIEDYVFHDDFFVDVASKTLRFNHNTSFPLASMLRVSKYRDKGFFVPKKEMIKMSLAVAQKGIPNSWGELESQIGGTYGQEISINNNGREFSYENVMEILNGDLDLEICQMDNSSKYSSFTVEDIIDFVLKREVNYIEVQSSSIYNPATYYKVEDGCIVSAIDAKIVSGGGNNYKKIESGRLVGYKVLFEDGGILYPAIRGKKSTVTYKIGEESSFTSNPFLYVFSGREYAKTRATGLNTPQTMSKVYKVSFDISDIKAVSWPTEIQVSKMLVESCEDAQIEQTKKYFEDFNF
jgi:hypothetical protein